MKRICTCFLPASLRMVLVSIATGTATAHAVQHVNDRTPFLRTEILADRILEFTVSDQTPITVSLLERTAEGQSNYDLFNGRALPVNEDGLRWSIGNGTLFVTGPTNHFDPFGPPALWVWPLRAFLPAEGQGNIDYDKVPGIERIPYGRKIGNQIPIAPVGAARMGIDGWQIGDPPMRDGLRITDRGSLPIHYDIRALDADRVELYMSVGGSLTRWLIDDHKWTLQQKYPTEISGPFMVYDEGRSLVADHDGKWTLYNRIDTDTPTIIPIGEVSDDHPLQLIEDRPNKTSYFEIGGDILDRTGKRIARIPADLEPAKRTSETIRAIRQHAN